MDPVTSQILFNLYLKKKENPLLILEVYDGNSAVPDPLYINNSSKNICLFDDMVTDSDQTLAENDYARNRHDTISCIYASQNDHLLTRKKQ